MYHSKRQAVSTNYAVKSACLVVCSSQMPAPIAGSELLKQYRTPAALLSELLPSLSPFSTPVSETPLKGIQP